MATLREEIQAKIDAIEAQYKADIAPLQAELNSGATWLDQQWSDLKAFVARIAGLLP